MAKTRRQREDDARKQEKAVREAREQRDENTRHQNALVEEQMRRDAIAARVLWERQGQVDDEITRRQMAAREILDAERADAAARSLARVEGDRARAEQLNLMHEADELMRLQAEMQRRAQPPT